MCDTKFFLTVNFARIILQKRRAHSQRNAPVVQARLDVRLQPTLTGCGIDVATQADHIVTERMVQRLEFEQPAAAATVLGTEHADNSVKLHVARLKSPVD